jgi:hypothetical protein
MPWLAPGGTGITTLFSNAQIAGPNGLVADQHQTIGPFQFASGASYDALISLYNGTTVEDAVAIEFTWTDNNNNIIDIQSYSALCASGTTNLHWIQINGPAVGTQLYVTFAGWGHPGTALLNVGCQLYQDLVTQKFRHSCRSLYRFNSNAAGFNVANSLNNSPLLGSGVAPAFTGLSNIQCDPTCSNIAEFDVNVPLSSSQTFILPLYNGEVFLAGATASGTNDFSVVIFKNSTTNQYNAGQVFAQFNSGVAGGSSPGVVVPQQFTLPRSQCAIKFSNNNAAAQLIQATLTAVE